MKNSFLTIVEYSIIPSLKKMKDDETKHLSYLEGIKGISVNKFIKNSKENLQAIIVSLNEYETYLRDNKNDNL